MRGGSRGSNNNLAATVLAIVVAMAAAPPVGAQTQEPTPIPFAFAYRLGSGVYAAGGGTLQIYRLPISATILKHEDRGFGIELALPVTLGFYGFRARDVLETGLPDHVGTASFTPGVHVPVTVFANWTLTPFVEGGPAWENETHTTSWVYGGGLESLATFPSGPGEFRLGNLLALVGEDPEDRPKGGFLELDTGLEYRLPVGWMVRGRELDFGGYAEGFRYWHEEAEITTFAAPTTRTLVANWEVGFTFGTVEPWKIWKIPLPRVGIGYRVGQDASTWRLVFGSPF